MVFDLRQKDHKRVDHEHFSMHQKRDTQIRQSFQLLRIRGFIFRTQVAKRFFLSTSPQI